MLAFILLTRSAFNRRQLIVLFHFLSRFDCMRNETACMRMNLLYSVYTVYKPNRCDRNAIHAYTHTHAHIHTGIEKVTLFFPQQPNNRRHFTATSHQPLHSFCDDESTGQQLSSDSLSPHTIKTHSQRKRHSQQQQYNNTHSFNIYHFFSVYFTGFSVFCVSFHSLKKIHTISFSFIKFV